jgi:hypothetical protein
MNRALAGDGIEVEMAALLAQLADPVRVAMVAELARGTMGARRPASATGGGRRSSRPTCRRW